MKFLGVEHFGEWLATQKVSLALTTYQTNRLFFFGYQDGKLAINERLFDKPMGLFAKDDNLFMSTRYQIWKFENHLTSGEQYKKADKLFVPSQSFITGDINVHDLVVDSNDQLIFVNTDFSCIAKLEPGFSFSPIWKPSYISNFAAQDRCHLNGLALKEGRATYVTACSVSDEAAGWRKTRKDGGVVIHIPDNEIITRGLSMPHSPRWYRDKLWVLNSGAGEFGYIDAGQFVAVTFLPAFLRGLTFWKHYAIVGLSKPRSKPFTELALEHRLANENLQAQCGVAVIDLNTGQLVSHLYFNEIVEELFDVVVLPNAINPSALGFQNDEIQRCINFPQSNGLIMTRPTVVSSPNLHTLPTPEHPLNINYQLIRQLTPQNLLPYESMTSPSLQKRWQNAAPIGELLGVSASLDGQMIGLMVVEYTFDKKVLNSSVLSLHVLPSLAQSKEIEQQLMALMQKSLNTIRLDATEHE